MKKSFIIPFGLTADQQAVFVAQTIAGNKPIKEFEFYLQFNTRDEGKVEELLAESTPIFCDDQTFPGVKLVISSSSKKAKRYFNNLMLQ